MSLVSSGTSLRSPDELWAQVTRLAFRFLFAIACVAAAGWGLSNVRQVPADSRAVILRFGAIAGERGPGLLIAWPRPIERLVILPARDRQLELTMEAGQSTELVGLEDDISTDARRNAAFLLTADSGVVRLQASIFYQITDAAAYLLAAEHVRSALQRLLAASAVAVCAGRELDSILIARAPTEADAERTPGARQERFRTDLVRALNLRLVALAAAGAGLGVTVSRVDLTASLPAVAKGAFDQVLTASQAADRQLAEARADATRIAQSAHQERERILADAAALAAERRTEAWTRTASVAAINPQYAGEARGALINRIYYERIAALLKKAGRVDAVDPRAASQLYLPGRAE
jgi:regulator of protease activity HflC (stomatin/prohibitin superfamily)